MAADGINSLRIQVSHGSDKHVITLELPATEAGGVLTLSHLAKEVARVTEVPVGHQKLICKGKSLSDLFAPLKSLGIKNNSKIMLIGKKVNAEADANMAVMARIETDLNKIEERLGKGIEELNGIENGYLPNGLVPEALKKLVLQVGACAEELTRCLERLDALTLASATPEVRQRRKTLVGKIQAQLDRCDSTRSAISERTEKQSK